MTEEETALEGPRYFGYAEAVAKILELEQAVGDLRARLEGRLPSPVYPDRELRAGEDDPADASQFPGVSTGASAPHTREKNPAAPALSYSPSPSAGFALRSAPARDDRAQLTVDRGPRPEAWVGSERVPCPQGCGAVVRRSGMARHLKRCPGA